MMEKTKWRFLKYFIERPNVSLKDCVKIVNDKKEELRGCYKEAIGFEDKNFVEIILVDAIFIVELFLTNFDFLIEDQEKSNAERKSDAEWVLNAIQDDLLLFENQLPFFIIKDVWKCATEKSIYEVFYDYFKSLIDFHSNGDTNLETINYKPKHFVDFVRELYKPTPNPEGRTEKVKTLHAPSITDLHRAGVEFKVIEKSKSLFDVSFSKGMFSKGILEIPKWRITDTTEVVFRNLIAFEQCINFAPEESYTCQYHSLMDCLVNSAEDVDLLIKKKIIENWLGDSNEVSSIINKLGNGVVISASESYFADIFNGLNEHCEHQRNKWIATFKENHLSTPWKTISLVAAFLLIALAIAQTVCSFISLKK